MEKPSKESITYITMLSAFQVVLNCQLDLKETIYEQDKKTVQKVREAVNMLNLNNSKNRNKIWKADEKQAADLMYAIEVIGKQIALGDGIALSAITQLTRDGFDLSKCKIVELDEETKK